LQLFHEEKEAFQENPPLFFQWSPEEMEVLKTPPH
jgi:hypothetical protein